MPMTADSRQLLPHTSPTAVVYRATPQDSARWSAASTAAYQARRDDQAAVLDRWAPVFAEAIEPHRVYVSYLHQERGQRWHRGHDHHFTPSGVYPPRLPYCRPLTSRGTHQAPDLRTRIGRALQEDLGWLDQRRPWTGLDQAWDLPSETGPETLPQRGADGRLLGRDTLISNSGCHYLVYEAPPVPAPDPQVWTPVSVAEYTAVQQEIRA